MLNKRLTFITHVTAVSVLYQLLSTRPGFCKQHLSMISYCLSPLNGQSWSIQIPKQKKDYLLVMDDNEFARKALWDRKPRKQENTNCNQKPHWTRTFFKLFPKTSVPKTFVYLYSRVSIYQMGSILQ